MSSVVFAGGIVLFLAIIIAVLVSINNKSRRGSAMKLVGRFNELGEKNNLSFTQKEMMENFVIGLDELRMKLFMLRKAGNQYDFQLVNLREIKSCLKKKIYQSINIGTEKKEKYVNYLDKIVLQFDFVDNREPLQIAFYASSGDNPLQLPELEQKANSWVAILTQTLNNKLKNRA